jgi:hypothetical protein
MQGGFTGSLSDSDLFGHRVKSIGDHDGDWIGDLAVGAWRDDDGGPNRGAVWILFLNPDGTVKSHQKISDTEGGFVGNLRDGDNFGLFAASLGDLDGDGVGDLAAGAGGGVWILHLNTDGTVKSQQRISETQGGFTGTLDDTIGTDADILVARSTDDGITWTAPAALNTNAASDAEHDSGVQVTTDGQGTWVAVWEYLDP